MGKLQSKHVRRPGRVPMEAGECFLVNAHLNKALEEQIWKKKSGLDLANYNMDESLSELSICLEDKCGSVPLRVELPPQMGETETSKVLKLDQDNGDDDEENKAEKANNLNIEEFECGVQFEGSEHSKQEWSFTLYDFDGHGRITKEDLASLLKALYDAVGSSIRLPPNGAKTLKLRLTVGQDRTQIHAISASKALTGGKRKENGGSGSKAKTSKESPKPPKQQFSKLNNLTRTTVKVNNQTLEAASQGQGQVPGGRKHLSAEDQQQLVELVQENMERNHVKQLRRHHSDCHAPGEKPGHHHKRRHRGRSSKTTAATAANGRGGATTATPTATAMALAEDRGGGGGGGCRESQDRRNYYLDLAGVDSSKLNNITTAAAAANSNPTKVCNNNQTSASSVLHPLLLEGGCSGGGGGGGHHRSRSHDVTAATMMTMTTTTTTTTVTGGGGGGGKYDNVKRESDRLLDSTAGASAPSGRGVVLGVVGFSPSSGLPTTSSSSHHHNHNLLQHSHHLRSRSFDPQDTANPRTSKSGTGGAGVTQANNATNPAVVLLDSTRGPGLGGSPSHKHSRFRPVSLPGGGGGGGGHVPLAATTTTAPAAAAAAVSPGHYHRRHRHREKDHDLAMQQVAAWIERQHAWDFDGQRSSGGSAGGGGSGGVIVQRHHHHHIHEHHHHHHYHHYYEA